MVTRINLIALSICLTTVLDGEAQTTISFKKWIGAKLIGQFESKENRDLSSFEDDRRIRTFGIVPSFGFGINQNLFGQVQFGYISKYTSTHGMLPNQSNPSEYSENVKYQTLVLGVGTTRFIPINSSAYFFTVDFGASFLASDLSGSLDYKDNGNVLNQSGSGSQRSFNLGIEPGFTVILQKRVLLGLTYGFIGINTTNTFLSYSGINLDRDDVTTEIDANFGSSTIQFRLAVFLN